MSTRVLAKTKQQLKFNFLNTQSIYLKRLKSILQKKKQLNFKGYALYLFYTCSVKVVSLVEKVVSKNNIFLTHIRNIVYVHKKT